MEAFDKTVFNTDCVGSSAATYQSPETLRDSVSDNMVNIYTHARTHACTLFIKGGPIVGKLQTAAM